MYFLFFFFCDHLNYLFTILITPFLSHDLIIIKTLIILNYNYTLLGVRSKPIRLNICLGFNDINKVIIKSRAIWASRGYLVLFNLAR